jgi:hypothetical protein
VDHGQHGVDDREEQEPRPEDLGPVLDEDSVEPDLRRFADNQFVAFFVEPMINRSIDQ